MLPIKTRIEIDELRQVIESLEYAEHLSSPHGCHPDCEACEREQLQAQLDKLLTPRVKGRMQWIPPRVLTALESVISAAECEASERFEVGRRNDDAECVEEARALEADVKKIRKFFL